jgi:hypothetical protein
MQAFFVYDFKAMPLRLGQDLSRFGFHTIDILASGLTCTICGGCDGQVARLCQFDQKWKIRAIDNTAIVWLTRTQSQI